MTLLKGDQPKRGNTNTQETQTGIRTPSWFETTVPVIERGPFRAFDRAAIAIGHSFLRSSICGDGGSRPVVLLIVVLNHCEIAARWILFYKARPGKGPRPGGRETPIQCVEINVWTVQRLTASHQVLSSSSYIHHPSVWGDVDCLLTAPRVSPSLSLSTILKSFHVA
jgi:hypothetical protein